MGEVYQVRHKTLDTIRCIKLMKPGLMDDESFKARFLREARLATRLQHPNVGAVHDFDTVGDGTYYLVSEFIDGITVRQWSKRHGRFPVNLAIFLVDQVLSGLSHIHSQGLLHRDVSADNIMITLDHDDEPQAKIIDLGIAKVVDGQADVTSATATGFFVGNPKYASPEQLGLLAEGEVIDGRADLYCLGVVLYEMLLGVPPFESRTPQGYVAKHLTQTPPRFGVVDSDLVLPDGLEDVVFKSLQKDRAYRHQSARDFAFELRPFLSLFNPSLDDYAEQIRRDLPSMQTEALLREVTPLPQRATGPQTPLTEDEIPETRAAPIELMPSGLPPGKDRITTSHPTSSVTADMPNAPSPGPLTPVRPVPESDPKSASFWATVTIATIVTIVVAVFFLRSGSTKATKTPVAVSPNTEESTPQTPTAGYTPHTRVDESAISSQPQTRPDQSVSSDSREPQGTRSNASVPATSRSPMEPVKRIASPTEDVRNYGANKDDAERTTDNSQRPASTIINDRGLPSVAAKSAGSKEPVAVVPSPGVDEGSPEEPGIPENRDSAPSARLGAIFNVEDVDKAPELQSTVAPIYPAEAVRVRAEATVLLSVVIAENGQVSDVTVVRDGPPLGFAEAAIDAVKQWTYAPGEKNGSRVRTRLTISIPFRLRFK